jgi:PKD domain/Secretion system C-terminal sorting domain
MTFDFMRYILLLLQCMSISLCAQNHDYHWFMGYQGGTQSPAGDEFGNIEFDFKFKNKPLFQQILNSNMNFHNTNSSICDSVGNLVCYTNGVKLFDKNHHLAENGNNLVMPFNADDYNFPQGALILPRPGTSDQYMQFSVERNQIDPTIGWKLFCHYINIDSTDNIKVVQKRKLLVQDSLSYGLLSAVKHANGRDWWILIPRYSSNIYYRILLSQDTITTDIFLVDEFTMSGLGQSCFSPDGSKCILALDLYLDQPAKIYLYDFDRCTGTLYNQRIKEIDSPGANFGAGCAVSADSKYLYVFHTAVTYQYDLTAPDIFATETLVGEYDGFVSGWYGSYYMFGQLGADGRIYVSSWVGTFHMHQINHPERAATDCQLINHSIASPVYLTAGIPSFPNFRLGPIDGSTCDSLGFDNHPLSNWRWEQEDTLTPLQVTFTDLSSYEPANWFWDFGDGTGSLDRYPNHIYAAPGVYEVCLTVSNEYDSDTYCQVVNLGVSGLETPDTKAVVSVWPNPFTDQLGVDISSAVWSPVIRLYDVSGRCVLQQKGYSGFNVVNTAELGAGMYFYSVEAKGETAKTGKLVKL